MQFIKKEHRKLNKKDYDYFLLAGDIGGTNTKFGIFGVRGKNLFILESFHFQSKKLKNLYSAINEAIAYANQNHKIKIVKCCLGVAGPLTPEKDYVKVMNANLGLIKKELLKESGLKYVLLINDFEAIGYGINMVSKDDIRQIKNGKSHEKEPILAIGAGTGLGKTLLIYNEHYKSYVPLPSEVHHSDFAAQNELEFDLVNFIKKYRKIMQNVTIGDLLSGDGLANIYAFLRKNRAYNLTEFAKEIEKSGIQPEMISKYRKIDSICMETFKIFKSIYARIAKNLALDALPFGGIYIAGGIAQKNPEIFDKEFVNIFESNQRMSHILKRIPIYLILNENIGLLGAGFAGAKFLAKR